MRADDVINRIGQQCDTIAEAEALGWRDRFGLECSGRWYDIADRNDGIPEHLIGSYLIALSSACTFLAEHEPEPDEDPYIQRYLDRDARELARWENGR